MSPHNDLTHVQELIDAAKSRRSHPKSIISSNCPTKYVRMGKKSTSRKLHVKLERLFQLS